MMIKEVWSSLVVKTWVMVRHFFVWSKERDQPEPINSLLQSIFIDVHCDMKRPLIIPFGNIVKFSIISVLRITLVCVCLCVCTVHAYIDRDRVTSSFFRILVWWKCCVFPCWPFHLFLEKTDLQKLNASFGNVLAEIQFQLSLSECRTHKTRFSRTNFFTPWCIVKLFRFLVASSDACQAEGIRRLPDLQMRPSRTWGVGPVDSRIPSHVSISLCWLSQM